MKQQTRLQILEEIATKVAELNIMGNGKLSDDIIAKAFSLQTKKKRNDITKQKKPRTIRKVEEVVQESIGIPIKTNSVFPEISVK